MLMLVIQIRITNKTILNVLNNRLAKPVLARVLQHICVRLGCSFKVVQCYYSIVVSAVGINILTTNVLQNSLACDLE